ncbi:DUF1653 domain-containing protein [Candidatus Woesebacteria bacterium]|nr:DUF1653 domain-containing protein [Candidatus Woesebacteria bacterium]
MKTGKYRHFKGGMYRVIGMVKHSESLEEFVLYEALYDNPTSRFWVRPAAMFEEDVEYEGKRMKRFEFIGRR